MRKSNLSVAALIGALALTGCSRNPVAPQADIPTDPSASSARLMPYVEPVSPGNEGVGGLTSTIHVESGGAGTLTLGRWSLTIHKNSHIDPATISMSIPDLNSMEVEIQVSPASANVFQVPIELVADCADQVSMVADDNSVFWWSDGWVQASDVTVQAGSMLFKAKSNQLMNAKVAAKPVTIHNGNKKN